MIEAIARQEDREVNDTKSYDNGIKVVPSYLLEPVTVDKSNIEQVLLDARLLHRGPAQAADPRTPGRRPGRAAAGRPGPHAPAPRPTTRHRSTRRTRHVTDTILADARHHQGPSPASRRCPTSTSTCSAARSTRSAARTAPASRP